VNFNVSDCIYIVDVTRAPRYSEHTEEVLTTILGYTPEQVAELQDQGIVRESE
jgi:crotonobetainyl-CoA:carnitine CoA-transferase CaiB-like acyl-CoA transferase